MVVLIVLGIESTAHTLGIGICRNKEILSNEMDTYKPKNEGIIPRKAADHHSEVFLKILNQALCKAGVKIEDVDLISFAQGPGIGAPLKVGVIGAKYLALKYSKKIIGVNHPYAHIKISELYSKIEKPLILYISGGNTQILIEKKPFEFQILGETFDIGVGNLFDNFARKLGIEYASGAEIERLAKTGRYIEFPYTVKGMNLTFSGLLTYAENLIGKESKEDLCYSLMETAFSELCEATERALYLTKRKGIIVCGGVAQNKRIQQMLKTMCDEDGIEFGVAPDEFNRDNGAMIAYAGYLMHKQFGDRKVEVLDADQNYRIEQIKEKMKN
ncbi:MAG: KEOPS complex N(6)-L-threonylcarbamoyladenine synthase Kae1 [Candidatus Micrarchaeia archaeon]